MDNKWFKKILLTEEQLASKAKEIGKLITKKHGDQEVMLVGLLKGSYVFCADVARNIDNPNISMEFIVASSYHGSTSSADVKILLDLKTSVHNKIIILLEDIVDTGNTLNAVKHMLLNRGAKTVEIAAMCTKPARRTVDVQIDYPTYEIPNEFVVGYGLDYNEHYRHLPYVAALTEEAIEHFK